MMMYLQIWFAASLLFGVLWALVFGPLGNGRGDPWIAVATRRAGQEEDAA